MSSGAVQNHSSGSSSASPDDSSGDSSEGGGARDKTTPSVKTRPTRKGRFVKGWYMIYIYLLVRERSLRRYIKVVHKFKTSLIFGA